MYRIVVYPEAQDQIAALPDAALRDYAEVASVLEASPWNGPPHHRSNPDGAVRRWHFGPKTAGQVVYLIVEDIQEVHVLLVQWLG
ncbi:MAG: hypothetical protein ACT4NP_09585 [Pseudonocardiales bacterium]